MIKEKNDKRHFKNKEKMIHSISIRYKIESVITDPIHIKRIKTDMLI